MAKIMNRAKEMRDYGHTVIILHNTNKGSDEDFTGSMTIYDESGHILLMKRIKDIRSDEEVKDNSEESKTRNEALPALARLWR
jgi:hypothetical protein